MSFNRAKPWYVDYILIVIGTGLMALAINSIFDASGLVTGGFSGIAIIIKAWTENIIEGGIPLWVTNVGLNIPLFLIGIKIKGFSFVKKAIIGEISLSTWLAIQPVFNLAGDDLLLAAVYGGVIQGVGIGLVFLGRGTTGGTDMMAALIQKHIPHYSISQVMQFIDGLVVVIGVYVFGIYRALYAIIAVFLVAKVSDGIIEGLKFSKAAYIITDKPQEISNMIMKEIGRGVTGISARGMYSQKEKMMLFCVVSKKEIVMLKERVSEIDPKAFVIVGDAREVHGEGFIEKI
ncbi:MAG TPA: YitT family protein [Candidatus Blautia faecavium]|uniref:YitT family protein n=1 Tax=Candidatus Blautia faecavium TaxID=2838487 RepID=A0A9D2LUT1_9FIRM|nr:YitT family protein [Candidatus Blautia faecavium]